MHLNNIFSVFICGKRCFQPRHNFCALPLSINKTRQDQKVAIDDRLNVLRIILLRLRSTV